MKKLEPNENFLSESDKQWWIKMNGEKIKQAELDREEGNIIPKYALREPNNSVSDFEAKVAAKIDNFHKDFITKIDNDVDFLKDKSIILDSNITIHEINGESGK